MVLIVSANWQNSGLCKSCQDDVCLLSSCEMFANPLTPFYKQWIVWDRDGSPRSSPGLGMDVITVSVTKDRASESIINPRN